MKLPKELTTVTTLSKTIALIMFVTMPIIGFFLGMRYQETLDLISRLEAPIRPIPTPTPTINTTNWKTYTIPNIATFKYPPSYIVENNTPNVFSIADKKESLTPAQTFIMIDAQMLGTFANYDKTIKSIHGEKEQLANGVKTTTIGTINGNQRMKYTNIYYKYKDGAIVVEYGDNLGGSRLYDQILQTFTLTNSASR